MRHRDIEGRACARIHEEDTMIDMPKQRLRNAMAFAVMSPILLMALSARGADADVPDVKMSAVLDGSGVREVDAAHGHAGAIVETIWIKGAHVRVDFDGGPSMRGRILRDAEHAWLLQPDVERALPADHVPLASITRLDPQNPCWAMGVSCVRADDRLIAGRRASGWRYSNVGQAGPNGTDSGIFWIDTQYGVLLAFDATDISGRSYRMETASIDFAKLPDSTFTAPHWLSQPNQSAALSVK